jgi:hypothetical protein
MTRIPPSQPEATPPHRDGDPGSAALAKSSASSSAAALTEALDRYGQAIRCLRAGEWLGDEMRITAENLATAARAALERSIAAAREADRAEIERLRGALMGMANRNTDYCIDAGPCFCLYPVWKPEVRPPGGADRHSEACLIARAALAAKEPSRERESEGGGDR